MKKTKKKKNKKRKTSNKALGSMYERKILDKFIDFFNFTKYSSSKRNLVNSELTLSRVSSTALDDLGVDLHFNDRLLSPIWRELGIQVKRFTFDFGVTSFRVPLDWIMNRAEVVKEYGLSIPLFIIGMYQKTENAGIMRSKKDLVVLELDHFLPMLEAWTEKQQSDHFVSKLK